MGSIVLSTATRYLFALLLLFSIFVLLRGHNEPGGGFIAGLLVSIGVVMHYLASGFSWASARLTGSWKVTRSCTRRRSASCAVPD